jgi:hypothetical protein
MLILGFFKHSVKMEYAKFFGYDQQAQIPYQFVSLSEIFVYLKQLSYPGLFKSLLVQTNPSNQP